MRDSSMPNHLVGPRNTIKSVIQDNWSLGKDLKPGSPETWTRNDNHLTTMSHPTLQTKRKQFTTITNFSTLTASLLCNAVGSLRRGAFTLLAVGCVNMALLSMLSNSISPCGEALWAGLLGPAPSTESGISRCSTAASRSGNSVEMRLDDPTCCGFFTVGGGNGNFLPGSAGAADPAELGRSSKQMTNMRCNSKLK